MPPTRSILGLLLIAAASTVVLARDRHHEREY